MAHFLFMDRENPGRTIDIRARNTKNAWERLKEYEVERVARHNPDSSRVQIERISIKQMKKLYTLEIKFAKPEWVKGATGRNY